MTIFLLAISRWPFQNRRRRIAPALSKQFRLSSEDTTMHTTFLRPQNARPRLVSRLLLVLGSLVVLSAPAQAAPIYWNVFNIEGESTASARLVVYATLDDMLYDRNRVSTVTPGSAAPQNVVGGDSDGNVFWNVFNIEGESTESARIVVYGTLEDMLYDRNRLRNVAPGTAAPQNIVGSGSDGQFYWNVFNIEGESTESARFVVYGTLEDMLYDRNRLRNVAPGPAAPQNIVGSGATIVSTRPTPGVPEPSTMMLIASACCAFLARRGGVLRRHRAG